MSHREKRRSSGQHLLEHEQKLVTEFRRVKEKYDELAMVPMSKVDRMSKKEQEKFITDYQSRKQVFDEAKRKLQRHRTRQAKTLPFKKNEVRRKLRELLRRTSLQQFGPSYSGRKRVLQPNDIFSIKGERMDLTFSVMLDRGTDKEEEWAGFLNLNECMRELEVATLKFPNRRISVEIARSVYGKRKDVQTIDYVAHLDVV